MSVPHPTTARQTYLAELHPILNPCLLALLLLFSTPSVIVSPELLDLLWSVCAGRLLVLEMLWICGEYTRDVHGFGGGAGCQLSSMF